MPHAARYLHAHPFTTAMCYRFETTSDAAPRAIISIDAMLSVSTRAKRAINLLMASSLVALISCASGVRLELYLRTTMIARDSGTLTTTAGPRK
jgi:hypothetical protein